MKSVELRQAELEARRTELQGRIDQIKTELDSHQDRDWEELATQREGDEVLEGMGNDAQAELRAIAAALKRVAEVVLVTLQDAQDTSEDTPSSQ